MLKEGAHIEDNSSEKIEHRSGFSKETLKRLIEGHRGIGGSGKSGIVLRVPKEKLTPEEQSVMDLDDADNPEGSVSIKALKIFDIAKAKIEFEALQEARNIVLKHTESSPTPLARVPRAIKFDEIEVNQETQDFLNKNGAIILDGKVGIITMDWIEGKDLGAILREELSKRTTEGEDAYQRKLWDDPNCDEIIRILEKKGFVLPESIVAQIQTTVEVIHKKNLYHHDIHPGNIIIKNGDLENPQTYMIDWADATHETRPIEETEGEYFLSDEKMVKNLVPLTRTFEDKKKNAQEAALKEWGDRIALLEKQPKAKQQYELLKIALAGNEINILEGQFISSAGFDRDIENFLGNLLRLAREDEIYRKRVIEFLKSHTTNKNIKVRAFVLNRIRALESAIES